MSIRVRLRSVLEFAAWGVLLGLAYGQAPLYTSNQNQYFLHGLAQAGQGLLADDWLANAIDPSPVFTWLVFVSTRYLPQAIFYAYYFLLFGVYLYSLRRIADRLFHLERSEAARWVFLALIFVTHSAALRVLLGRGLGGEWEYLFDGGLAGQRLLGTVLQPSTFGVLLLLSVQQFLDRRTHRAVLAAAVAPDRRSCADPGTSCTGLLLSRIYSLCRRCSGTLGPVPPSRAFRAAQKCERATTTVSTRFMYWSPNPELSAAAC